MSGWGNFAGKIADQFQGRIERLKNEKRKLLNERNKLIMQEFTVDLGHRVIAIDDRVSEINAILETKASD